VPLKATHTAPDATIPIKALRRVGPVWAALAVAAFLLIIVFSAALAGFRAGLAKNASVSATETAAEAAHQYELGLQDLAGGHLLTAAERFRFVLSLDPQHAEAAEKLAEVEASLIQTAGAPTATPVATAMPAATAEPRAAPEVLLQQAQAALDGQEWDRAISLLTQLQARHPGFEAEQAAAASYRAYRERGLARIADFRLQEGILDLNLAETYGALDEEADAYRVWATLYVRGNALWGADWPATVAIFQDLYRAAPYFHDTMAKLAGAQLAYGDLLRAQGDPCAAAEQYAGSNEVQPDPAVDAKRLTAEADCAAITPTPSPGPEGAPAAPSGTPAP
jgi:tetratricopeptide (TPR) repeat protein